LVGVSARRPTAEGLVLAGVVLLQAVVVWSTRYFPSADGPAHVEGAAALLRLWSDEGGLVPRFYELGPLQPNWTGHALLALLQLLVPGWLAEKALLTAYVALLPLSCRYALGAVPGSSPWLALLVAPLTFNWLLYMGFYNFCLALPLAFVLVGFWLRASRQKLDRRRASLLGGLALLTGLTHPVPLLVAFGVILLLALARPEGVGARGLAGSLLPFLPILVVLVLSLGGRPGAGVDAAWGTDRAAAVWAYMRTLGVLEAFTTAVRAPAAATAGLFAAAAAAALGAKVWGRRFSRWDALLLPVLGITALALVAPAHVAGGAFMTPRLVLFPFLLLPLWLATAPWPRLVPIGLGLGAALLAVWVQLVSYPEHRRRADALAEFASAGAAVRPHATLLALSYDLSRPPDMLTSGVDVFVHAGGYIAAERRGLNLSNYEGHSGHFPLRFRAEMDPYRWLGVGGGLEGLPPCVDLDAFHRRTGVAVDYVYTWGRRPDDRHPCTLSLGAQLDASFDLVHTTSPRGLGHLYRRRPHAAAVVPREGNGPQPRATSRGRGA
jgi:hypothetical protein